MKCTHCQSDSTIKYGTKETPTGYCQRMKCKTCNREFGINRSSTVKRAIVTPDKHFPLHDPAAISVLTQAIELVKPEIYVDLGDVGEWSHFSRFKFKGKEKPPLEYMISECNDDIIDVNLGMDIIDEALDKVHCDEKYMCEGNHDNWVNEFALRYPYTNYSFKEAVNLEDRGYKYYAMGKHLKLGHLYLYHGHLYGGQYHTSNHLRKLGCNVMYGHWHDVQHMTVTHMDGPKAAWSLGCLKDMRAESNGWLKNRKVNWGHAFAIVDFYGDNGEFTVNVVQIIDGRASIWGTLLDGNDNKAYTAKSSKVSDRRIESNVRTTAEIRT